MPEYLVSRTLVLNREAAPRSVGPAIKALQQANLRLEQSMPRQQPVPAYQPRMTEVRSLEVPARSA